MEEAKKNDKISIYLQDKEYIANNYVLECFAVTMLVYTAAYVLNLVGVFVIDQQLMWNAFIPSAFIYFGVYIVTRFVSLSNTKLKYFILFCIISMFTVSGVFLTYHVVLVMLLPILYAVLYSSKPVIRYVLILTIISTIIVVYGGYYFGLCDANMVLLTTERMSTYVSEGSFIVSEINSNPVLLQTDSGKLSGKESHNG